MRKFLILSLIFIFFVIAGCNKKEPQIIIDDCDYCFTFTEGEQIPIKSLSSTSTIVGNVDNFINVCKKEDINPLIFKDSTSRMNTVIIDFEHIFPIDELIFFNYEGKKADTLNFVSISYSYNGLQFEKLKDNIKLDKVTTIDFNNQMVKSVRLQFDGSKNYGINHLKFILGNGYYVKLDEELNSIFRRDTYWTGADGIFTFNLTDGVDTLNQQNKETLLIFSDTFIGDVGPTGIRRSTSMINNSLGYLTGDDWKNIRFSYPTIDDKPRSAFIPNYYLGSKARNLSDPQGLTASLSKEGLLTNKNEGVMWQSLLKEDTELVLDFYDTVAINSLYIWNFNEDVNNGMKTFDLAYSLDGVTYTSLNNYTIDKASGLDNSAYQLEILLGNKKLRYLKFNNFTNYGGINVGLGKIVAFSDENYLYYKASANYEITEITENEKTSRLWLQDGVVIDNYFYVFPILVKNYGNSFKVHNVSLIKVPIVDNELNVEEAIYLDTPLQVEMANAQIFYGAGVMNLISVDGYIYIYGYKDENGRHLTVARTTKENFEDFNKWTYFDGETFQLDIKKSKGLMTGVSAELSINVINDGIYAGKYMLVSMENTISGKVSYSISDSPIGPFSPWYQIYQTPEQSIYNQGTTYNAKMHPHLSKNGTYLISYNVNSNSLVELSKADVYRPRFIWLIEIKKKGE